MKAIQETTVWDVPNKCNHTYLMDGEWAVAYIKQGDTIPFTFKSPIRIDLRGRTFKTVVVPAFKAAPDANEITVAGSNGASYIVNTLTKTCTCPGFTFRGACKHTKDLK